MRERLGAGELGLDIYGMREKLQLLRLEYRRWADQVKLSANRPGGATATVSKSGGAARVIALSYGERGESGELWKEAGQTEERVKEIRRDEVGAAARYSRPSSCPLI